MIDDLPPLREVIARHGLSARKTLGQNFLLDLNLTARIARATDPLEEFNFLEIGPGPGGLTRALLAEGAAHVTAIERDRRCIGALEEIAAHYPGRLTVIEGDALQIDHQSIVQQPVKIAANLPYNISVVLLTRWLTAEPWPPWFKSLTLMFQKEVAERITALPGTKSYGRISVLAAVKAHSNRLFDVHPSAFTPPPKVTSAIVQLTPESQEFESLNIATLERVTAAAFGQRRKMLRQSLKPLGVPIDLLLENTSLEATMRAENVPPEAFCQIAVNLDGAQT
ncbi:MAG: 16S rRNA (adenine(1518)-N(6)/adenine(1519)-N(6))-dimethyltransferase RsmA [Hyphomicrobiales bacterium]